MTGTESDAPAMTSAASAPQWALFDAVPDALLIVGVDRRVTYVNEAFRTLTGYGAAALLGRGAPYPFWASDDERAGDERFAEVKRSGAGEFEMRLRRADGRLCPMLVSARAAHDSSGAFIGYLATYKDLSAVRFEARLERALREVAQAGAGGEADERELANLVAARVTELLATRWAGVMRFDPGAVTVLGHAGEFPFPRTLASEDNTVSGQVARTARSARIDDYGAVAGQFATLAAAHEIRGAVAVPVRVRGALWGCLGAMTATPGGLPPGTEALLERFAALVSSIFAEAQAVRLLQESERRYRREADRRAAVFNAAHDAVFTMAADGTAVELNDAACAMFGVRREDVLGRDLHEIMTPARNRELARRGMERYRATGNAEVLDRVRETVGRRADGSEFPIEIAVAMVRNATPPVFIGVVRDVSERKAAERRLRESEERYRMVVETSVGGIFDDDLAAGSVWWSPQLFELLGYDPERFPARRDWVLSELIHPTDLPSVEALLDSGSDHGNIALRVRHADGSYRTTIVRARVARDTHGVAVRMLGSVTDVTELKAAEGQRAALARELHDSVVQDLAGARMYADTARKAAAQRPETLPDVLDELCVQLGSAEDNMRLIIRALRSDTTLLERRGSISALSAACCEELRRRDPELTVKLTDSLDDSLEAGPLIASTFGHVLREALLNILHHARARTVNVRVCAAGGLLVLEVTDDGAGFDPAQAPEGHFGVQGMRERVHAAAGRFELDSAPGQGTRLTVELPQPLPAPGPG